MWDEEHISRFLWFTSNEIREMLRFFELEHINYNPTPTLLKDDPCLVPAFSGWRNFFPRIYIGYNILLLECWEQLYSQIAVGLLMGIL